MTPIVGDIIQTVGNLASDLYTSEKESRQLDIDDYNAETKRLESQTEINKIEAGSASLWVAGARPFIMWVCGVAFAYATVLEPILRFGSKVWFGYTGDFPVIDTNLTMQVLFGILGLGVMRSFDKVKGTAK
jgi:hypothetical protein